MKPRGGANIVEMGRKPRHCLGCCVWACVCSCIHPGSFWMSNVAGTVLSLLSTTSCSGVGVGRFAANLAAGRSRRACSSSWSRRSGRRSVADGTEDSERERLILAPTNLISPHGDTGQRYHSGSSAGCVLYTEHAVYG